MTRRLTLTQYKKGQSQDGNCCKLQPPDKGKADWAPYALIHKFAAKHHNQNETLRIRFQGPTHNHYQQ